ncbi:MAG: tripartite tricarboxylate transporter substrate binding protein [Alphaproteobacteria bacterium]|nr:tripartite tricarboxylate transporter substrate binding protein [Alphaproteobacteria bacterium]
MHSLRLSTLAVAALLSGLAAPSHAADWPAKPVTVIVPFGAGGNTDMMARLGAQHLAAKLGQSFVIENRPSAGGALATGQVAAAAPDGYTLLFAASSMIVLTPQLQKLTFDPMKQLVPITNMGTGTQMIAIKRELPVKTLPEFIAYAKANPGKLNYTVAGTQNISHLAPALLFARAGIDIVLVPQKSEPAAIADLMAGQVDLYFGNSSSLLPHINSDRVRLIAVGTPTRLSVAPDIPSVSETLPGFEFSSWNGFLAPAGTPDSIVTTLRDEVTAFAKSPEISERLSKLGIIPGGMTKEQNEAAFKKDYESFLAAAKAAGIEPPK